MVLLMGRVVGDVLTPFRRVNQFITAFSSQKNTFNSPSTAGLNICTKTSEKERWVGDQSIFQGSHGVGWCLVPARGCGVAGHPDYLRSFGTPHLVTPGV